MRKYTSLLILLISCNTHKNTGSEATSNKMEQTATEVEKIYFEGIGNEPFWSLSISNKKIIFNSMDESLNLTIPHINPHKAMDANVKMYHFKSENEELVIKIQEGNCLDNMSEIVHNYQVEVQLKNSHMDALMVFKGCGNYVLDYRLHDIWNLESINGKLLEVGSESGKKRPYIEINTKEKKFMGFGGCNSISGKIWSEEQIVRFNSIISTKKMCFDAEIETNFLKTLEKIIHFKIENNSLILSNPNGDIIVFKKGD